MLAPKIKSGETHPILIVGAGMSGLAAQYVLKLNGIDAPILEKSRGLGGRASTRRGDHFRADQGAQFFRMQGDAWLNSSDHKRESLQKIYLTPKSEHPRFVAPEGMSSLARFFDDHPIVIPLEKVVDVKRNTQSQGKPIYTLSTESGNGFLASNIILTAPLPQSLDLLEQSQFQFDDPKLHSELRAIDYDPCIAVIFELENEITIGGYGIWKNPSPRLSGIYNQTEKGVISRTPTLVVHLGPESSKLHWDLDAKETTMIIQAEMQRCLEERNISAVVVKSHFHRWKYSEPLRCYPHSFVDLGKPGYHCLLAGDAFKHSSIEGAIESGRAAANALLRVT